MHHSYHIVPTVLASRFMYHIMYHTMYHIAYHVTYNISHHVSNSPTFTAGLFTVPDVTCSTSYVLRAAVSSRIPHTHVFSLITYHCPVRIVEMLTMYNVEITTTSSNDNRIMIFISISISHLFVAFMLDNVTVNIKCFQNTGLIKNVYCGHVEHYRTEQKYKPLG